ncbi:hypothetical protein HHK36_021896 [Tetracentron sinense]|uniref:Ubiquinone biosynthesis protein n=1 Tax=Tetracentron sinense TaxID=13715 RepID=A0A834YT06_TETSI|nr:hypothetical protein HHK36_021896 [Tetracentron sinense]
MMTGAGSNGREALGRDSQFAGEIGSPELLPWSLSSGGFASSLLRTSHVVSEERIGGGDGATGSSPIVAVHLDLRGKRERHVEASGKVTWKIKKPPRRSLDILFHIKQVRYKPPFPTLFSPKCSDVKMYRSVAKRLFFLPSYSNNVLHRFGISPTIINSSCFSTEANAQSFSHQNYKNQQQQRIQPETLVSVETLDSASVSVAEEEARRHDSRSSREGERQQRGEYQDEQIRVLQAALRHVVSTFNLFLFFVFDVAVKDLGVVIATIVRVRFGWTEAAMITGAREVGVSPSMIGSFPRKEAALVEFKDACVANSSLAMWRLKTRDGLIEKDAISDLLLCMIEFGVKQGGSLGPSSFSFFDMHASKFDDDLLIDRIDSGEELSNLILSDRISKIVRIRLEMQAPYISKWPQALSIQAQPMNVPTSFKQRAMLVDEIWHAAGDQASDIDWYVKRTVLGAIYSTSEVYMLTDVSPDFRDTWAFLDHRIRDVFDIEKSIQESLLVPSIASAEGEQEEMLCFDADSGLYFQCNNMEL